MSGKVSTASKKRLEITMRDVMDGLEDTAIFTHYRLNAGVIEVLSIDATDRTPPTLTKSKIININQMVSGSSSKCPILSEIKIPA